MVFEFDDNKSRRNLTKHGIDFVEAQALWRDPRLVDVPARTFGGEVRRAAIGRIGDRVWVAIYTERGTDDHQTIRLISTRRARPQERRHYLDG
jgi:uncharacterized protein